MLHWKDQPEFLKGCEEVVHFNFRNRQLAVYRDSDTFYVTAGNLFGSQTVECEDAVAAIGVIKIASEAMEHKSEPPRGVKIIPNAKSVYEEG